jgi:hypothetical protein
MSTYISQRVDVLAKLNVERGGGTVTSATVDLVQIERYLAEPDPTVWTYPVRKTEGEGEEEDDFSSDDGFPEVRSSGVSLRKGMSLVPLGGSGSHCREKVLSQGLHG